MSETRVQDLIRLKRDGAELPENVIRELIAGVVDGSLPDYQTASLLMAIYFRGLSEAELSVWTDAMLHSGTVAELSHIAAPKVDKHSTGGVGDKVSICLAPLVAACGAAVPMISGRGLGHTGGTLDKLEAIPGFDTRADLRRFAELVEQCGMALIGQTDDLAPADRRLYALRDVTGTVESIPLIASSIMSKKLAEGLDALVMDVKVGSGAFMKTHERARELARTIKSIGERAGVSVSALISDMSQPLGCAVGNANETREAIEVLRGGGPADLWLLTRELGCEMLLAAQVVDDHAEGYAQIERARASGTGLARLRQCIELQGGDPRVVDQLDLLPLAAQQRTVRAPRGGVVARIDTEQIGSAAMLLGAGRERVDDPIDHGAGLAISVRLGDEVHQGDRTAELHFSAGARADQAEQLIQRAIELDDEAPPPPPLVHEVIRGA